MKVLIQRPNEKNQIRKISSGQFKKYCYRYPDLIIMPTY